MNRSDIARMLFILNPCYHHRLNSKHNLYCVVSLPISTASKFGHLIFISNLKMFRPTSDFDKQLGKIITVAL